MHMISLFDIEGLRGGGLIEGGLIEGGACFECLPDKGDLIERGA